MAVAATRKVQRHIQKMQENGLVKDISWEIDQKSYVIHNVPFKIYDEYTSERVYSSEVTVKLLLLKDLMESNEIPSELDFQRTMKN